MTPSNRRRPEERPRVWPLGLEPDIIEQTLRNVPIGRKHESGAELDAIARWMPVRELLLRLVAEREAGSGG